MNSHDDAPTRSDAPPVDASTGRLVDWIGITDTDPERVAGYRIEGKLGQGGMGVVFKAVHPDLKRPAAVKRLLSGRHAAERERVRFLAEAEAMAAVRHPHVVTVYDFGTADGQPFLAMEYLDGGSLAAKLGTNGRLPTGEAVELIAKIADGVQAAHDQGIVHRDLKPGNVLLDTAGEPKVTDFGLAKRGESGDTASHAVMGTVGYMAPEQARGQTKRAGPAADVYALGAVLFRCLAGRPPFAGDELAEVLLRVIDEEAPSVSSINAAIPRDLALIVAKCLEKDPARRYPTAAALAADLRRFRAGEPVAARPVGSAERAVKWVRRRPYLAGVSVALVLSLLIGTVASTALALWALQHKNRADAEAASAREAATAAEAAAARAKAVSDALAGVFKSSDPLDIFTDGLVPPTWEKQRTKTAEDLLRDATAQFRTALTTQPLARGRLLGTAGVSFRNLGLMADAAPLLDESLVLLRQSLPADHPDIAAAEVELGRLHLDRGDYPAALAHLRAAGDRLRRGGADDVAVTNAQIFEAWALVVLGNDEALAVLDDVIAVRERAEGPTSKTALIARLGKVACLLELGRPQECVTLVPGITVGLEALPEGQPRTITRTLFQGQTGLVLAMTAGRNEFLLKQAASQLRATDAALEAALPARNVYRALVRFYLAQVVLKQGDTAECDRQLDECLTDLRCHCGLAHPKAALVTRFRANRYVAAGQPAKAEELYAECEAATVARYGPASNVLGLLLLDRCEFEADHKRWEDAAATARRVLALGDQIAPTRAACRTTYDAATSLRNGPAAVTRASTLSLLRLTHKLATAAGSPGGEFLSLRDEADELRQAGRHRDAEAALTACEAALARHPKATPVERNIALVYRGRLEADRGDFAAAEQAYRAAAELSKGFTGKQAVYYVDDLRDLAGALADQKRYAEAEAELVKATKAANGKKPAIRADVAAKLAAVRRSQGATDGVSVRVLRQAAAGGLAGFIPPRCSADPGFPYFGTDWMDRLP